MRRATLIARRGVNKSHRPAAGTVLFLDDFVGSQGTALDVTKWTYDVGRGSSGWGNSELEYYTNSTTNARLDGNGNAEIVLRSDGAPDADAARPYTSARVNSLAYFIPPVSIESRMSVPTEPGTWPAFWTLAHSGWPTSGEIDIHEIPTIADPGLGTVNGIQSKVYMTTIAGQQAAPTTKGQQQTIYDTGWDLGSASFTNWIQNPKAATNLNGISGVTVTGESTGSNLTRLTAGLPTNLASAGFTTCMRYTVSTTNAGARGVVWSSSTTTLAAIGAVVGGKISAGAWVAASFAQGAKMIVQYFQGGTFLSQSNGNTITDANGGLSLIENATIPASCDTLHVTIQGTPTTATVGQTVDVAGGTLVVGTTLPRNGSGQASQVADGDTAGWKWSGTANASTSSVSAFHTFRADWYTDRVDRYLDGVLRASHTKAAFLAAGNQWPFDGTYPHRLLFNMAMGGTFPGNPQTPPVPWTSLSMLVDYIKVTAL